MRSVRGPCVFDARRAHAVFVGPGFEPLTLQVNLCTGPRFDSRAWLPVSGQWNPWPMSLAHAIGESGWLAEKQNLHEEKNC